MGKERERDSWVTENEIGRIFENFWYTHRELIFFFSKEGRADSEKLSFLKRSVLTVQVACSLGQWRAPNSLSIVSIVISLSQISMLAETHRPWTRPLSLSLSLSPTISLPSPWPSPSFHPLPPFYLSNPNSPFSHPREILLNSLQNPQRLQVPLL